MNTELIKALKEDAEWAHANEWETPITLGDHLDDAADRLEAADKRVKELKAAQKELIDYHHTQKTVDGKMAENTRLRRIIDKLTTRAEAAEAERDACKADLQSIVTQSVKDMEKRNWTPPCRYCSKYFVCDYIPEEGGCCFEWRGPQAGKGE